jgi:polyhydroxyalkanoate synthesis regulator phasin
VAKNTSKKVVTRLGHLFLPCFQQVRYTPDLGSPFSPATFKSRGEFRQDARKEEAVKHNADTSEWKDKAAGLVDDLINKGIINLKDDKKITVQDLVKLFQLREELAEDQPKEVTVQWIDQKNDE